MSTSINVTAYSGKDSKEFQKHFGAVKFCIENDLSFPRETSEFFQGKLNGLDLEDLIPEAIISEIENGVQIDLPMTADKHGNEIRIKVSEIPASVDEIVIKLS